jgi:adenosylmethionine---8-amino-7-oxononanoate aminotransferase
LLPWGKNNHYWIHVSGFLFHVKCFLVLISKLHSSQALILFLSLALNMSLSERDAAVVWHPYTQMKIAGSPIAITRGEGAYLYDESGNSYIDAVSSWWVNIHGHAHPYIAEKVSAQLRELEHVIFAGFTHRPAVELAERLLEKLPGDQARVFYSDNGSTAVEVALKMAFQYWHNKAKQRTKIIAFKDAYHGDTFGAMSVSGRGSFTQPFFPFLFDVHFIDPPLEGNEAVRQLQDLIDKEEEAIAAFIFEPLIQGTAGMKMHSEQGLSELVKLCRKHGIFTIADEVMTGFGRTGKMFASEYLTESPDIFCLSKGITGGTMAMGVTTCTREIFDAFFSDDRLKTFFHGHSYTANPVSCAAALASLDLMEKEETWESIQRITESHSKFITGIKDSPVLLGCRSIGTIAAMELDAGESSYFSSIRDKAYSFFLENGIILRPLGNIIYILPPYCISQDDLDHIYSTIKLFIRNVEAGTHQP